MHPKCTVTFTLIHRKPTCFRKDDAGAPDIRFGEDIYMGASVVDPNAQLSVTCAAAHEICHFYRWNDKRELEDNDYRDLDEAWTSLEAILRFPKQLNDGEARELAADAMQRIMLFIQSKGIK